ncbi:hypothetical protein BJ508DRAFT_312712 [Ascobolus immersus RN42]|uniref:Uncharacterized protein n=1 Tax=Ascobolus immersus RN42 TaxID=1160509 RepID=A0A3N4HS40_ASCIM|nr:hypothetical protein BJ508DRAFT_312712 [Ascobolus immersus RN42]
MSPLSTAPNLPTPPVRPSKLASPPPQESNELIETAITTSHNANSAGFNNSAATQNGDVETLAKTYGVNPRKRLRVEEDTRSISQVVIDGLLFRQFPIPPQASPALHLVQVLDLAQFLCFRGMEGVVSPILWIVKFCWTCSNWLGGDYSKSQKGSRRWALEAGLVDIPIPDALIQPLLETRVVLDVLKIVWSQLLTETQWEALDEGSLQCWSIRILLQRQTDFNEEPAEDGMPWQEKLTLILQENPKLPVSINKVMQALPNGASDEEEEKGDLDEGLFTFIEALEAVLIAVPVDEAPQAVEMPANVEDAALPVGEDDLALLEVVDGVKTAEAQTATEGVEVGENDHLMEIAEEGEQPVPEAVATGEVPGTSQQPEEGSAEGGTAPSEQEEQLVDVVEEYWGDEFPLFLGWVKLLSV